MEQNDYRTYLGDGEIYPYPVARYCETNLVKERDRFSESKKLRLQEDDLVTRYCETNFIKERDRFRESKKLRHEEDAFPINTSHRNVPIKTLVKAEIRKARLQEDDRVARYCETNSIKERDRFRESKRLRHEEDAFPINTGHRNVPIKTLVKAEIIKERLLEDDRVARYRETNFIKERDRFPESKKLRLEEDAFPINTGHRNVPIKTLVKAEIRKAIVPKSPVAVLTELAGFVSFNVIENDPENEYQNSKNYTACCEIEGEIFSGSGPNTSLAKSICAESAIRGIYLKRHDLALEEYDNSVHGHQINPLKNYVEEEQDAWKALACVGLYKMFNDWSAEGLEIPQAYLKSPAKDVATEAVKPLQVKKNLPKNPTDFHPVSLITMMCENLKFIDLGETGDGLVRIFTASVLVNAGCNNEESYQGRGKTKKEAKKSCAMNALKEKFDIIYPQSDISCNAVINKY